MTRHMRLAFFPLTDLGNAERFRERSAGRLLFNTALATTSPGRQRGWLAWDGKRWSSESGAERVMIAEHDTVRAIQEEAECVARAAIAMRIDAERWRPRLCRRGRSATAQTCCIPTRSRVGAERRSRHRSSARYRSAGAPYLSVGIGHLDADRMKINVNNGTLVVAQAR
jgi:putative DNA primase/helicase